MTYEGHFRDGDLTPDTAKLNEQAAFGFLNIDSIDARMMLSIMRDACSHPDAAGSPEDYWPTLHAKLNAIANA